MMNPIVAFSKLIRLPNLLIIVLTQYAIRYGVMFPLLDINGFELQMPPVDFFLLCLSTVMIAASGYIINDYFDLKIDRVNRPDKIIIGKHLKRRLAMGAHVVINSLAIIIAGYVAYSVGNWKLIFIQLMAAGALWYYSISFKKQVLIGNVVVAMLAATVPFVAGLYELILQHTNAEESVNGILFFLEEEMPFDQVMVAFKEILANIMKWVIGFAFFAFLSTMVREIIKDIEDYEGDKKYFSNTLPVMYGIQKGKLVAQLFIIVMVVLIAYLQFKQLQAQDMTSFMYFVFAIQIPLIYVGYQLKLAKEKVDFTKLSKYMKLIMLMGIVYSGLFYYSIIVNVAS
ncbi:MAG: geranylgeranylglycerol-phosphate geranylgeranyltransferase [Vicingus serpentipes]|nr:geranylgeranylglycerol-phosphate geranylgeranyltransferase [Vicingus serpentipes]